VVFEADSTIILVKFRLQGYLAHRKTPTPLGPPLDPRHMPTIGSLGCAFSYERGTLIGIREGGNEVRCASHLLVGLGVRIQKFEFGVSIQGYPTYKKTHTPRTLPYACA